jgi:hypothetical protein
MGQSGPARASHGPVTAERAPVAESEQGAGPVVWYLGSWAHWPRQIPATSFGRAVVLLFMSWKGWIRYASVGWDFAWGCGLALALWFGTFKRHCLGTPGAHCPLPTAHYSRARSGCGSGVTSRSLPFDRSGGDGERYQLRSSAEPSKIHLVSAAPCISACNSPSALPRKTPWSRGHGVGPQS